MVSQPLALGLQSSQPFLIITGYCYLTKEPDTCEQPIGSGQAANPLPYLGPLANTYSSFNTKLKIFPTAKAFLMAHVSLGALKNHLMPARG